jgi:hypothetical protein
LHIPTDGIGFRRLSDVRAGNLVYLVDRQGPPTLALKVQHPGGRPGTDSYPAALILNADAGDLRLPLVDTTKGSWYCIDLGARPTVTWRPPLSAAPRDTPDRLGVGYLLVAGSTLALSSLYVGGRGDLVYWDLASGELFSIDHHEFAFITEWSIGLANSSGSFCQLESYPDGYRSRGLKP